MFPISNKGLFLVSESEERGLDSQESSRESGDLYYHGGKKTKRQRTGSKKVFACSISKSTQGKHWAETSGAGLELLARKKG